MSVACLLRCTLVIKNKFHLLSLCVMHEATILDFEVRVGQFWSRDTNFKGEPSLFFAFLICTSNFWVQMECPINQADAWQVGYYLLVSLAFFSV